MMAGLGLAPSNQKLEMRSLDFWRLENGKISENWVTVDLLHVYEQLGIDVFKRMREFNKARYGMAQYSPLVSDNDNKKELKKMSDMHKHRPFLILLAKKP